MRNRQMNMEKFHTARALRVLVAPDSFKGSLRADAVASRIAAGIRKARPGSVVIEAPIADGGEGTASAVATGLGGSWHSVAALDANADMVDLPFAACRSPALQEFAIFDVADIVGLPNATLAPGSRTTRGVGQAVREIAKLGFKTIVVGLGGSSTNDGGAGMLSELMVEFVDADNVRFHPVLETLSRIHALARKDDAAWLTGLKLIGLTDVTSPLAGPDGASHVFGAQKGLTDLAQADRLVDKFGAQMQGWMQADFSGIDGAGAAGGLGFALSMLGGTLQPGAEFILDALQLTQTAGNFDWIITGEGRSDRQTLLGKGPALVAAMARRHGVPVALLSGAVERHAALEAAFDGCFCVQSGPVSLQFAMNNAGDLVEAAAGQLAKMFAAASNQGMRCPTRGSAEALNNERC
jgi:glycerate kinase